MDETTGATPSGAGATGNASSGAAPPGTPTASQAAEQLKSTLTAADDHASQQVQVLGQVHQARLAQANRTVAALTAQYGAADPRVKAAQSSAAATQTTIARVALVQQQFAVPAVEVSKTGWALQGRVLDAQFQPAARFTVFFVDAKKAFLKKYGFAYTDETGYFLIDYAGDTKTTSATQLFVAVVDTNANPVYVSSASFEPAAGTATFQNIVLPAGGPLGDPTEAIRSIAFPGKDATPPAPAKE